MSKKNKCRKCENMLTCLLYEIGQEDMCDYKPHTNLLCKIFGHKYGKTIWHKELVDLSQQFVTRKRKRKHIYYYECKRCGCIKQLDHFQVLKIINKPK